MRARDILASEPVINLGLFVARYVPRWLAYGIARAIAGAIALFKPEMYKIVRRNLRQIVGDEVDDRALNHMAGQVFWHTSRSYTDFFRDARRTSEEIIQALKIVPDTFIQEVRAEMDRGQGVLLLGIHMSNFDLVLQAAGAYDLPAQMLSLPNPGPGVQVFNRLRIRGSAEITPIAPASLRAAIRRLKNGGLVVSAIDRPIPEDRELIEFFGRPAYLPTGPARLALMTGARVYVGACHHEKGKGYALHVRGPVELVQTGDRQQDVLDSTRLLAGVLEDYVREHPEQWLMFHPFWPEDDFSD